MAEVSSTKNKPKKSFSKIIAIVLGIICIISIVSAVALLANITRKYDQERTLAQCWENDRAIPSNLNDLFPNKIVIWKNKQVTEPSAQDATFAFLNYFNYTGCLLINITSSNAKSLDNADSVAISWNSTSPSRFPQYWNITFTSNDIDAPGDSYLFPVLPSNSLDVFIGNMGIAGNGDIITQTVTLTYYY
jgi:flagellar basal body-associated protein FliL